MRNVIKKCLVTSTLLAAFAVQADEYNFDVYLNDKKVGTHQFAVSKVAEQRLVQSTASFKVKFLFFSAYSYQHSNTEKWDDDCLRTFDAKTNLNGRPVEVSGATGESGFVVEKSDSTELLPDCVMSFAYWNPEFLKQERLLNPQTGDFLDVDVESMGVELLEVRGEMVQAQRYKVTAKDIDLMVWYSDKNEWLGLESMAKPGQVIRYELS